MAWSRLIRFLDDQDKVAFGEPEISKDSDLLEKLERKELYVSELAGRSPFDISATGKRVHVKSVLAVLTPEDVPIVRCIGLNYMKHSIYPLNMRPHPLVLNLKQLLKVAENPRRIHPSLSNLQLVLLVLMKTSLYQGWHKKINWIMRVNLYVKLRRHSVTSY